MHVQVLTAICVLLAIASVAQSRRWFASDVGCWITQKKVPATWEDAHRRCQKYGAVLASPLNTRLLDYMQTLITVHNHSAPYFIGIRADRSFDDQEVRFVSKEGERLDDMPRAVYDAIEKLDLEKGDCLSMGRNGISAVQCYDLLPYICYSNETKVCGLVPTTTSTTPAPTTSTPPPGYKFNSATGSYYKFHTETVSWDEAEATCAEEGASLLVLNDAAEVNALTSIEGFTYGTWVGLRDRRMKGKSHWRTVHGQPVNEVYHQWLPNRPLNTGLYNCGYYYQSDRNLWDENCATSYYFTCEITQ